MTPGYFKNIFLSLCLLTGQFMEAAGQTSKNGDKNFIVIGELAGRTDSQSLLLAGFRNLYFLSKCQFPHDFRILDDSEGHLSIKGLSFQSAASNSSFLIKYSFYNSEWDLISDLILEKIDFARLVFEESAREIGKSNRSIHVSPELLPPYTSTNIIFNCRHSVLKYKEVRQALAYAIDKNGIIEGLLKKRADVARGPFNTDYQAYESSLIEYKYNPKRALKLLEALGWQDKNANGILEDANGTPLSIKLVYRKGLILDEQLTRWIKINWNQIGIDVQPQPMTWQETRTRLSQSQFEAVLLDYQFQEDISTIEQWFTSGNAGNFSGYSNPKLDNYVKLYRRISNPARTKILMQGIQKILNEDQPVVFLYFKWLVFNFINRNRIENYLDENGNFRPMNEWKIRAPGSGQPMK